MATETTTTERGRWTGVVPYRMTVRRFESMIAAGMFPERPRIELLDGFLVKRMVKNHPHNFTVDVTARALRTLVEPALVVREEKSIQLGRWSRPEPDVAVLRGPRENYRARGPQAADLILAVEVSDSTYVKDRNRMWQIYAAAMIPTYWIVNFLERRVEVYTNPTGQGKAAKYQDTKLFAADAEVPVVVDGREVGRVRVEDLLP